MNKQNLGYRFGQLYLKFRQWQHPTVLKWLYVLVPVAGVFIFSNFFARAFPFIIVFGIVIATRQARHVNSGSVEYHKKAGFREGHSGFGYYNKNNWKVF